MSIKMFMLHRRECYPGSSAVGGPDTRVTLASTITIQLNTGLHPNIIYTYNTYMLCYAAMVLQLVLTTSQPAPPRHPDNRSLVMNLVSLYNLI